MDDSKPWYLSRGVWGSVVVIAASGLGLLGYTVSPDDQAAALDIVDKGITIGAEIVALSGGVVSLWGRVVATKKIGA